MKTMNKRPEADEVPNIVIVSEDEPAASTALGANLERMRNEEQARVDREKQEELAKMRELARFD